jgi:hypothetical protein
MVTSVLLLKNCVSEQAMNNRGLIAAFLFCVTFCGPALAQLPPFLKEAVEEKSSTRSANDQVEGTIWEYRGKLEKDNVKNGETPKLEGKFRLEDAAIFDISPTIKLPSKEEVKKVIDKVATGKGGELKLPSAPQQKRLGEYRKLSGGKFRLDFSGEDSLNGLMIIWKKKDTQDVWMGTFDEREGTKTIRKWDVELRAIED